MNNERLYFLLTLTKINKVCNVFLVNTLLTNDNKSYCKVLPLIFIHHNVELDSIFSLVISRSSKEDRESLSLVPRVYLYPHVHWVKKKNSINKVTPLGFYRHRDISIL